ncbi:MAG TPA: glycoside hydrolase family 28 protein, partial [Candidatus Methylacidiphilales bacterium]|nr:glycoside hydrolase family 28 protein [Candidatus Methylacidiphilales bacterium]
HLMNPFSKILIILFLSAGLSQAQNVSPAQNQPPPAPKQFNVRDFGATGDGKTNNTSFLQKALDACAAAGGGEVVVPAGNYLTGSLVLHSHVTLNIEQNAVLQGSGDTADYPLGTARWEGIESPAYRALISADHAEDIAIIGAGTIAGDQQIGHLRHPRAPTLIEPVECKNVRVDGLTLTGSRIWTLHPTYCQNVVISNVTFNTTEANSDNIDPDSCRGVKIDHCTFSCGDDDIAIKSGKGMEGAKIARPCEDIEITNCTFLKGYSSIAFGSELSGGIQKVHIAHCVFKKGRAALYLKSRPGRGGYATDITAEDLETAEPLLEIQTTYTSNPDKQGIPGDNGITSFARIQISNVKSTSGRLVTVDATEKKPIDGLTLSDVTGSCADGFILKNIKNIELKNINLTGLHGPLLYTLNVQGDGLNGSVPYTGGQR